MPRRESEEEDDAPQPPGFSTPTKVIRNDGTGHAEQDAEGTESESDADVEKQFCESTGKKRNYTGYQKYRFIKQWVTGGDAVLEETEIQHEIYTEMKKFMHASGLKKTLGHKRISFISGSSIRKRIATTGQAIGRGLFDVRSAIDVDVKRR
jgi:hypothetical protein